MIPTLRAGPRNGVYEARDVHGGPPSASFPGGKPAQQTSLKLSLSVVKKHMEDSSGSLDMDVSREVVSLRQRATDKIREAILSGRFAPGQRLVERDLWQSLGISRTVVREALQHLQAEGLITTIPYKGPVVATLSLQDANELYEVRGALESLACAGFARNASEAQMVRLRASLEFLHTPQASATPKHLLDAKNAFYAILLEGCGNKVIGDILTQLNNRVSVLRRVSLGSPGRLPQTLAELEEIVQAIERRDADTAAQLAASHVARAANIVRATFQQRTSPA